MSEGQKGGEFYTPTSIVRLIVEILEPYHGRIFDPACGSGGMFIQSAGFVEVHKSSRTLTPGPSPTGRGEKYSGDPVKEISVHGQERVTETARLARLNLALLQPRRGWSLRSKGRSFFGSSRAFSLRGRAGRPRSVGRGSFTLHQNQKAPAFAVAEAGALREGEEGG
jgi:hypothetical protein